MDENQYRKTYDAVNPERCVFEKAILARQINCGCANRFCLAEREGVSCNKQAARQRCEAILGLLRENARFALGTSQQGGELPHAKFIKLQVGGLRGIQAVLEGMDESTVPEVSDVNALLNAAIERYASLDNLPFDHVVPFIAAYRGRPRKRPRRS